MTFACRTYCYDGARLRSVSAVGNQMAWQCIFARSLLLSSACFEEIKLLE
jgi:hypothetical protein